MKNVNNVPKDTERFIVARVCEGELWYWGSWDNREDALKAAKEQDGAVIDKEAIWSL